MEGKFIQRRIYEDNCTFDLVKAAATILSWLKLNMAFLILSSTAGIVTLI